MNKRLWLFVGAFAILMSLGLAGEARAQVTPSCGGSTCLDSCNVYCASKNSTCFLPSVHVQCGECGPGTCHFDCASMSGQTFACTCGSCGGSPIFRKQDMGTGTTKPNTAGKPDKDQKSNDQKTEKGSGSAPAGKSVSCP